MNIIFSFLVLTIAMFIIGCNSSTDDFQKSKMAQPLQGDEYIFRTADGTELYVTDGNSTRLLNNIRTDTRSSDVTTVIEYKNKLIFNADDGIHGQELFISDGTEAGTRLLADLNPGNASSFPHHFTIYNGEVCFNANNALWCTDATEAGTREIARFENFSNLSPFNNQLYFFVRYQVAISSLPEQLPGDAPKYYQKIELWSSDATQKGTKKIKTLYEGTDSSDLFFNSQVTLDERFCFYGNDGIHGKEWWCSDGTAEGTRLLKDINPGKESNVYIPSFLVFNHDLLFTAKESDNVIRLWSSDGTTEGTHPLFPKGSPDEGITQLFKSSDDTSFYYLTQRNGINMLYKSDGTIKNTVLVLNDVSDNIAIFGEAIVIFDNRTYSITTLHHDKTQTHETFDDGTQFGGHFIFEGKLYYVVNTDETQTLYQYEGVQAKTLISIPHHFDRNGNQLTLYKSYFFPTSRGLYLTMRHKNYENELWYTDGTPTNTHMLKDINTITKSSNPIFGLWWQAHYYFVATNDQLDECLYRSNGTDEGTLQLLCFEKNPVIIGYQLAADFMLLRTTEALWSIRKNETTPIKLSGSGRAFHPMMTPYHGNLYYFTEKPAYGFWVSDGTQEGTRLVEPGLFGISGMSIYNDKMFFMANNSIYGNELFVSDGNHTHILQDINPGKANAMFECTQGITSLCKSDPLVFNDRLYFSAVDENNSFGPYESEGNTEKTHRISPKLLVPNSPLVTFKDSIYYNTYSNTYNINGHIDTNSQLYRYNTKTGQETLIQKINGDALILGHSESLLFFYSSEFEFIDGAPTKAKHQLWSTDGNDLTLVTESKLNTNTVCSIDDTFIFTLVYPSDSIYSTDGKDMQTLVKMDPGDVQISLKACHRIGNNLLLHSIISDRFNAKNNTDALFMTDGSKDGTYRIW